MYEPTFQFRKRPVSTKARLEAMGLRIEMLDEEFGMIYKREGEIPFENLDQIRDHLREWVDENLARINEI